MRLPRDVSGDNLAQALRIFGYHATRQTGSPVRLTTQEQGEHHITIPRHHPLRVGTLSAILSAVAEHLDINREELSKRLFGQGG
jgi:predicted RNA binding protein YcfA (HicA-like mRNA interferase family)